MRNQSIPHLCIGGGFFRSRGSPDTKEYQSAKASICGKNFYIIFYGKLILIRFFCLGKTITTLCLLFSIISTKIIEKAEKCREASTLSDRKHPLIANISLFSLSARVPGGPYPRPRCRKSRPKSSNTPTPSTARWYGNGF